MHLRRFAPLALVFATFVLSGFAAPRAADRQATAAKTTQGITTADVTSQPFWADVPDAASLTRAADAHLAHARSILDRLTSTAAPHTIANTLRPYDDIQIEIGLAQGPANGIRRLHPDPEFRRAAEAIGEKVGAFQSALSLNRDVYDALSGIDLARVDDEARYYVERELRTFKLAGVDRDESTREKLQALRQDLVTIQQEFSRNISAGGHSFTVGKTELAGLPNDFIARHKVDATGEVTLTTSDADARPVLTYASRDALRHQMYVTLNTVGYPANRIVLARMLATRAEIAHLVGFPNWAEYDMAPRMAGTAGVASEFIDRVAAASADKATREYRVLLARKHQDEPGASVVNAWENMYYAELVRRANYAFDSQQVRPYFAFDKVKAGVLDVTGRLFGVSYRRLERAHVWHPSVEAYELLRDGRVAGRFYLDLHPRDGKEGNGATTLTVRKGVAGRQIPEIVLAAALPGGTAGDPGLLTHNEVTTLFHEFGHVVHIILGGNRPWVGTSGTPSERDYNETSSQMLEEWAWDPATLALFARHYQTGATIPAALVGQMRRASEFGKALNVRSQIMLARMSLTMHEQDPKDLDPHAVWREVQRRYVPFPFVEEAHFETRFPHLANVNYSASYYTYMWSLVIAKDFFSRFDSRDLLAPAAARRYRDTVLVPGASKPASALVQAFLGRPFTFDAWQAWLDRE